MPEQPPHHREPRTIDSPLRGVELISTFTAAKILFPNETITKARLRVVQRLCQLGELEAYKIGRKYHIVKPSMYDYLEDHYYPVAKNASD